MLPSFAMGLELRLRIVSSRLCWEHFSREMPCNEQGPGFERVAGLTRTPVCAHTRKLKPRGAVSRWRSKICPFFLQALESKARQKDPSGYFHATSDGRQLNSLTVGTREILPMRE